jgi:hypothetical protein
VKRRAAAVFVVALCTATSAHADDAPDPATAEALFEDARQLMLEGNYAAACPKLAASYKIDTALGNTGLGTMLNLALCHERNGQTATAWVEYQDAAVAADRRGEAERAKFARARAVILEPMLTRILVRVVASSPGEVLARDGVPIAEAAIGTAVPVDPGAHMITATGPGRISWSTTVDATAGAGIIAVDVPPLAPVEPDAPPPQPVDPSGSSQKTVAMIVGAVGLVGLGVGAGFGLSANAKWSSAKNDHCIDTECDSEGISLTHDAKRAATISTIAFIAGGAAVAGGVVLFFTAPRASAPTALGFRPSRDGGELSLRVALP